MKLKSFKSKILLYFILFTTIPLVIGSSIILYQTYKSKKESVFHKHHQILKQVEEEVNAIVLNIENMGQYVRDKYNRKGNDILTGLTRVQKNIATILILDNNGILKDFGSNTKTSIFKGFDYSNTKHFSAIRNGAKDYWSEVYLSHTTSLPVISYTLRIDKNNIAVLIIKLDTLKDFANKFKSIDGSSLVRITDQNGIFIAHPDNPTFVLERKNIFNTNLYKYFISKNYKYKQIQFINKTNIKTLGVYTTTEKLGWYLIVKESYDFLFKTFNTLMWLTVLFILILLIISIYFSIKLSKSVLKPLDKVSSKMDDIAHGRYSENIAQSNYVELNKLILNFKLMQEAISTRENKIITEIDKNKQKEKLLAQQSKMASMGEMLENIAHQWRQPLSVISTASTGVLMQKEFKISTEKEEIEALNIINNSAQHLSKTIDDFRDFFNPNKEKNFFNLKEVYQKSIVLLDSKFKNREIEVIENIDDVETYGLDSELIQAIMNILNNARDILEIKEKYERRLILIDIFKENNYAIIKIKDNGGGISSNIIDKIFEPYFTTKHQTQGTGIGLYMTEEMIVKHMNGKILVENEVFVYEDESYRGACFTISLPITKK